MLASRGAVHALHGCITADQQADQQADAADAAATDQDFRQCEPVYWPSRYQQGNWKDDYFNFSAFTFYSPYLFSPSF